MDLLAMGILLIIKYTDVLYIHGRIKEYIKVNGEIIK
jgi:hypothetical protein